VVGRYEDFQRDGAICVRSVFSAEEVALAERGIEPSPEFPSLADELPAGAPIEHPLFPIVWAA
jgi:hypothetical protein